MLNYLRFFGINYYLFLLSVSGLLLVSSRTRLANYPKFRAFILFSSPMMQHCTRQGRVNPSRDKIYQYGGQMGISDRKVGGDIL